MPGLIPTRQIICGNRIGIKTNDINKNIEDSIIELYEALKSLGGNNFKLLILHEKICTENFEIDNNNIIVRPIDFYAPDDDVTSSKYFDNGFDKIWEEFYCKKKKRKKKKYKFEIK